MFAKRQSLTTVLGAAISVSILVLALWFLHKELAGLSREVIQAQIGTIPRFALLASLLMAVCSYLVLTCYDVLALQYLDRRLPYKQTATTSFMAYAVGHNVGIAALSGGSIRYRMYSLAGLSGSEIATLIVFLTITFAVGASALLGIALLLMPAAQTEVLRLPAAMVPVLAGCLLAIPLLYLGVVFVRKTTVAVGNWTIPVPTTGIALKQVAVAVTDLLFASATLYVLLEPVLHIGYFTFLGIYLLAMGAGVISSVPGGIGVFEAVLLATLPQIETSTLLGTIVVYRLIYYVLPLLVALLLLVFNEGRQHGEVLGKTTAKAGAWLSAIAPRVIGVVVFLAGAALLFSGAVPVVEARLTLISKGIPLPVLELSHLAGSVIGTGLLILSRGLFRRLYGAYLFTVAALILGILVSLIKGLDYEEALILSVVLAALWFSRAEFYRRETIAVQPFTVPWIATIVSVLIAALWVGLVSYPQVDYSSSLWWKFAFNADAPRMLRATMIAGVTVLSFSLWKILQGRNHPPETVNVDAENEALRSVVAASDSSFSNAALMGDKRLLWSADRQAFIMYQVMGRSWVALGDPVGPPGYREELAWAFRELVDRHDGRTVFYEVSEECLPLYLDIGLTLFKLGEDARVSLTDFTVQGSSRAGLRQASNHAKKLGATFEIVAAEHVPAIVTDLRRISDEWLGDKSTAEKGFSLGSFSETYIEQFDCAVVRVNSEIVAFANLWSGAPGGELSIDLMRYNSRAPKGVMDYLFVELMLWGAAQKYQSFSLGMAPLSGLEQRPLAPMWHKLGHLIFSHGENFYNFEGLRNYKAKFDPQWKPRYLACPGGWVNLSQALFDTSRLISGGTAELIIKH